MSLPYTYPSVNVDHFKLDCDFISQVHPNLKVLTVNNSGHICKDVTDKYMLVQVVPNKEGYQISKSNSIKFHEGVMNIPRTGLFIEDLLVIAIDRLLTHQEGKYPCDANAEALKYLDKAIDALSQRSK